MPLRAIATCLCVVGVSAFVTSLPSNAQGLDRKAFYVGLHGGINVPRETVSEFDSPGLPGGVGFITAEAENGYRVGGAVGYIFNRYLRGEVELSYTRNSLDTLDAVTFAFPAGTGPLPAKGSATTLSGMVNGYASLPLDRLRPYIGAGIGYTRLRWFSGRDERCGERLQLATDGRLGLPAHAQPGARRPLSLPACERV